jgi:hypothetical protein
MAPTSPRNLDLQMQRVFEHGAMQRACKSFAGGTLPPFVSHLQVGTIEPGLQKVARAFVDLQEKRHAADYDLIHTFTKQEAVDDIEKAKDAFAAWASIRQSPHANLFPVALAMPKVGGWREK